MNELDEHESGPEGLDDAAIELGDDDRVELPELDGDVDPAASALLEPVGEELGPEREGWLDDESVGLDDEAAEEAAAAEIEPLADVEAESWETGEDDALEADEDLADGESERWTEGLEPDEDTAPFALDEGVDELGAEQVEDDGAEGLADDPGELSLPPLPEGPGEEEYPDDL